MAQPRSIEARIRDCYDSLTPTERRLADTILNFPGELASYNANELADIAKVSKAGTTRFFRRLGYQSYEEARRDARDAQRWGSALYMQTRSAETRGLSEALSHHLECELSNLDATFRDLPTAVAEEIVTALVGARQVVCLGFRSSQMIASYAHWLLLRVRGGVRLLPQAGETLAEQLATVGEGDVVLAVGLRRRLPLFCAALEAARGRGARIVLIADPTARRSAELADWVIRCEGRSPSLFDSDTCAMSVVQFLCSAAANRSGTPGHQRLEDIERLHRALHEFE